MSRYIRVGWKTAKNLEDYMLENISLYILD